MDWLLFFSKFVNNNYTMKLSIKEKERLLTKYGEWAIVTGASSGIGLELASQLAEAGFNIMIVARNLDKLKKVQDELETKFNIIILIVAADVSSSEGISKIIASSKDLKIGLLIVSAGYGTSGYFIDNSIYEEVDMLRVNCEALLILSHYYGQYFIQQKRGGLILLSSMVAFQGTPYASNYAATKAYVQTLAEGLREEFKPYGVDILAAAPGPVESGFGQRAKMKMSMSLTPSQVGVPILRALGKSTTVLPGLLTKILVYSLRMVPRNMKVKIMQKVMGGMTGHKLAP